MEGRQALLGTTLVLATASASYMWWTSLSASKKDRLRKRVKDALATVLSRSSTKEAPAKPSYGSDVHDGKLGSNDRVLSRDDVKEIMKALLESACEAEKNLTVCITDSEASPQVAVNQTEAVAMLIKSCAPLKTVRESAKEKFNVTEADMIEAMDWYKTADQEIMDLDSKIANTQQLISEKSKTLISLLAPANLDRSSQTANEVTAT